jgi:PPOX class probable F420-dependent enzyme
MSGVVPAFLSQSGDRSISTNKEVRVAIPSEIRGQKYICLTTFRKSGVAVQTPVWFSEANDKLYVKTRNDSGKYKRIRNNARVQIAPCTVRGKVTGPQFDASARILPPEDWLAAQKTMEQKYWLTRLPFLWSKKNEFVEISLE